MSVLKVNWVLHLVRPLILSVWFWSYEAVSVLVESLLVIWKFIVTPLMGGSFLSIVLPCAKVFLAVWFTRLGKSSSLVSTLMVVLVVESLLMS